MTQDQTTHQNREPSTLRGDHWDQEVKRIGEELVYLKQRFLHERSRSYYKLVSLKIGVVRLHLELEQALERLKGFTSRELLLLPRDSAIIRWTRLFVDKILHYFRLNHDLKSKSLWLHLLSAKVSGDRSKHHINDPHSLDLTADLVELPLRYKALCNTETHLRQAIEQRKQTIDQLADQYHAQQVAEANQEAQRSLQGRLGTNFENASKSPFIRALGRLVVVAVAPIKNPVTFLRLEQLLTEQEDQQRQILGLCREMADGGRDGEGDGHWVAEKIKDKLAQKLQQAKEIESDVIAAYKALLAPDCPLFHPIIVQNLPKKATNRDIDLAHPPWGT